MASDDRSDIITRSSSLSVSENDSVDSANLNIDTALENENLDEADNAMAMEDLLDFQGPI